MGKQGKKKTEKKRKEGSSFSDVRQAGKESELRVESQ